MATGGKCGVASVAVLVDLDGGRAPDGAQLLSEPSVAAMQEQQVTVPDGSLARGWGLGANRAEVPDSIREVGHQVEREAESRGAPVSLVLHPAEADIGHRFMVSKHGRIVAEKKFS